MNTNTRPEQGNSVERLPERHGKKQGVVYHWRCERSSEYIFDNQKEDGRAICDKFYETNVRVISIVKRTKVGMDGLIIEVAKNMATHPDNNFALHRDISLSRR
jgi:hypothetical protein